jgi:carboxyl-terminal processing protease
MKRFAIALCRNFGAVMVLAATAIAAPANADSSSSAGVSGLPVGIWLSDGYGWVIDVRPGGARALYHVAGDTCLTDKGDAPERGLETFYPVRRDADGKGITGFTTENITRFHFRHISALPAACTAPIRANDPELNFEILWQTFNEHYAFFKERGVDWYKIYQRYHPQIKQINTSDKLFTLFSTMLDELNDRHVSLSAPGRDEYRSGLGPVIKAMASDYGRLPTHKQTGFYDYFIARLAEHKLIIDQNYLAGFGQKSGNDLITWGMVGKDIGYLRIDAMNGLAATERYPAERPILSTALDRALELFKDAKGVVIDVRFNLGGYDGHSLELAGRFTREPRRAFSKRARYGAGWTEAQPMRVTPTGNRQFTGPVMLLTSNVTVSAGENLLLAMMEFPNVTRVGATTASVHSDQLNKPLPNGWSFSVSNEVFEAPDGTVYETRGVPPHVKVAGPQILVFGNKSDPVLEKAITLIKNPSPKQQ